MQSFRIEDPLDQPSQGAVEAVVTMDDGSERWCFFFDPERLSLAGDRVEGSGVRFHLGAPHMVTVSELTESAIGDVLRQLDREGSLVTHARALSAVR